ncbi:uncharacterized protein LOC144646537 isoform X2 [Oculina patagonica]
MNSMLLLIFMLIEMKWEFTSWGLCSTASSSERKSESRNSEPPGIGENLLHYNLSSKQSRSSRSLVWEMFQSHPEQQMIFTSVKGLSFLCHQSLFSLKRMGRLTSSSKPPFLTASAFFHVLNPKCFLFLFFSLSRPLLSLPSGVTSKKQSTELANCLILHITSSLQK